MWVVSDVSRRNGGFLTARPSMRESLGRSLGRYSKSVISPIVQTACVSKDEAEQTFHCEMTWLNAAG